MIAGKFKPYYFYRYILWKLGNRSPISAVLKVTQRCNLKCKHCPWPQGNKDIPFRKWKNLIKDARSRGCILCIIEGGEPLLRKDLNKLITYAKNEGMLVSVITNGTCNLSYYNPDMFWISIDGVGKTHEKIRGRGTFKRLIKNIEQNKDKKKIALVTLSKINIHDIENICKFFSPLVNGIWFNFIYPYRSVEKISLNRVERINAAKTIYLLRPKYKIINSESFLKLVGRKHSCFPWLTLNISADGEIHHGCTVEQLEPCYCDNCDMSCYGELTQAFNLNMDAVQFLQKSLGLKSSKLLFLKKA